MSVLSYRLLISPLKVLHCLHRVLNKYSLGMSLDLNNDRLSIIRKSEESDEIKRNFFSQAALLSILLYGCTTWTLTKRIEKKLDGNCARMLRAILNKSWTQHPTKQQLYGHLPPISKTIQIRRTRHAGYCCRSKDELISDVPLLTPSHGSASLLIPINFFWLLYSWIKGTSLFS